MNLTAHKNITVVPVDYRGVNPWLRRWLSRMPNVTHARDIITGSAFWDDCLASWRNRIAKWFLANGADYLLMIDDDVVPGDGIIPLLESGADIAAARIGGKAGNELHRADDEVSMAAVKISRRALEKIPPPWFYFQPNTENTRIMCECRFFCSKAVEYGFRPIKTGYVLHLITVATTPAGETRYAHELESER